MERQLENLTPRIAALKTDERGPVPKFVQYVDEKPDFRVVDMEFMSRCIKHNLCFVCGNPLGKFKTFPIGPMCCVNRVTSEPPSHKDCALFAVTNCPFLTRPMAKRNERNLPDFKEMAGIPIKRNPGVVCLWTTRDWSRFKVGDGFLIRIGNPVGIEFWREARLASKGEVMEAVASGLPSLQAIAKEDGEPAIDELALAVERFNRLLDLFSWEQADAS